jgi:hypothetical protein
MNAGCIQCVAIVPRHIDDGGRIGGEAALRAEDALIAEAQRLLTLCLAKQTEPANLINNLLWLFDGPAQREAQRLAREALGD